MGRGSSHSNGGGGAKRKKGNRENGLELYRQFVEGGSFDIHRKLGYDPMFDRLIDPDSQVARDLESVFSPAETDINVYKGFPATDAQLDQIRSGSFSNPTISSTTTSKAAAHHYADGDPEYTTPVMMNVTIKKGTKIANARKLLGNNGMKAFEQEVTVWKGTKWNFGKLKPSGDGYVVNVTVSSR